MVKLYVFLLYSFAFTSIAASAVRVTSLKDLAIVKRFEEIIPHTRREVNVNEQRNTTILKDFTLFYGPIGRGLINVRAGLKATFQFDYRIKGVTSQYLADTDQLFRSALNQHEQILYNLSKQRYKGGLDVPFLNDLGLNLNQEHSEAEVQEAMSTVDRYSLKAIAARRIMQSFQGGRVRINGSLSVVGVTEFASEASIYVKVSRVILMDESVLHVVSSSKEDLIAGDAINNVLPIDNVSTDVIQEEGGNPLLR